MNSLSMKMVAYLVSPEVVQPELQKWILGGAGYSGIVATVCASVTSKDQSLIDISICANQHRISRQTSMLISKFKHDNDLLTLISIFFPM